jgi:thymidine phosphorylase
LEYLPTEIIQKKRNNFSHTNEELKWFISNFINKKIPDYQMSAWLMAVNFNGMDLEETVNYTKLLIAAQIQLRV